MSRSASLRSGDYRALFESTTDAYLRVRSAVLLGLYDDAQSRLRQTNFHDRFFATFLRAQIEIYRRRNLEAQIEKLLGLVAEVPKDPFILGEYHFVFGHLYQIVDDSLSGQRHHRLAVENYLAADLPVAAAHALYNLSISYKHLNQRTEFENVRTRLTEICESSEERRARLPWLRLEVNLALDFDEYETALKLLAEMETFAREEGRLRDLGSATCQTLYALLSLGRSDEAYELSRRQLPTHQNVIDEYRQLALRPLFTPLEAQRAYHRWKKIGIETVFLLPLLRLLLSRLVRAEEFETILKFAKLARRLSQNKQQAPSLVDHQYFEILALLQTGRHRAAEPLLSVYENQAAAWNCRKRQEKGRDLRRLLTSPDGQEASLLLDPIRKRMILSGESLDLTKKPLLLQFVEQLIRHDGLSVPELHRALYGRDYDPFLDEKKMHSLVDRARRDLKLGKLLQRTDGTVRLEPGLKAKALPSNQKDRQVASRRQRLLETIARTPAPVALSELEGDFDRDRRTLQMDLKHLVLAGQIAFQGSTKNRRYYAGDHR